MDIKKFTPANIGFDRLYRPKMDNIRLKSDCLVAAFARQKQVSERQPPITLVDAITQLRASNPDCALAVDNGENFPSLLDWLTANFANVMAMRGLKSAGTMAIDASLWQKKLAGLLLPSVVILRFSHHIVPDLTPAQIKIDAQPSGKINQLLLSQTYHCDADELRLDQTVQQALLAFAEPLLMIFGHYQLNKKRFWGNMSNALAQGFTGLTHSNDPQSLTLLTAQMNLWLAHVLPPHCNLAQLHSISDASEGRWFVRRHTCCLKYKLTGATKCSTCNLISQTEQQQRYRQAYFEHKTS